MKTKLEIDGNAYLVTAAQALAVMKALVGAPRLKSLYRSTSRIQIPPGEEFRHFLVTRPGEIRISSIDDDHLHVVDADHGDPDIENKPVAAPRARAIRAPRQPLLLAAPKGGGH